MPDFLELSTRQILSAYKNKSLSPVEYAEALIERVEKSEPKVAALWAFAPGRTLKEAKASEIRWQKGVPLGPLDGMPVTIKELIATRGEPVPMGTAAMELVPAEDDAPIAARLKEEGAIIFAKTTCPDYGMLSSGLSSFHALSRNPWNLEKNPGGSSAGAAAAGAAGYGPLHIGTDIGGSVRLPAGWSGLFGFKPSFGRVPLDPYYTGRCGGPMTRTVDDAAFLMDTITRPDWRDATALPYQKLDYHSPTVDLKRLKIGLMVDAGCGIEAEPEVVGAVKRAAEQFAEHGAAVVPLGPVLSRDMLDGLDVAWRARFWGMMQTLSDDAQGRILPYILEWAKAVSDVSPTAVAAGVDQTFAMRKTAAKAFQAVDIILSPVNPTVSFPAQWASPTNDPSHPFEHIAFTVPWNMGEQPACSVNCGFSKDGMPIGLQIVARRFQDELVFALARLFENWRGPIRDWPRYDR